MISGKPILIFSNKQDVSGAKSIDDLIISMGLRSSEFLQGFNSTSIRPDAASSDSFSDSNIDNGISWLINTTKDKFSVLDSRVKADLQQKEIEEKKKRLERERRVLRNKIASAFFSQIDPSLLPQDVSANPEDVFSSDEGESFLAGEIGADVLSGEGQTAALLVGYQRLALQMIGALYAPINKKKTPMTWTEIIEMLTEIRLELGL